MANDNGFKVILGRRVRIKYCPYEEDACKKCCLRGVGCARICEMYQDGAKVYFVPDEDSLEAEIDREIQKLHTAPCYDELRNFAYHFVEYGKKHK